MPGFRGCSEKGKSPYIHDSIPEEDPIGSYGKILPKIDGILQDCQRSYEKILRSCEFLNLILSYGILTNKSYR
jgi:hypothetical protein